MANSLLLELLKRKRFENQLGQIEDNPDVLNTGMDLPTVQQTMAQPTVGQAPLEQYSPLELLLMHLHLLNLTNPQPPDVQTAAVRG